MISERELLESLESIGMGYECGKSPCVKYLKSLETLGFVNLDGDMELTKFGRSMIHFLRERLTKNVSK